MVHGQTSSALVPPVLAWRVGRGRRREVYIDTYFALSCFNGARAGLLVGALDAGQQAWYSIASSLSAQKL